MTTHRKRSTPGRPKADPTDPQVAVNTARVRAALLLSGLTHAQVVEEARKRGLAPLTERSVQSLAAGGQRRSRESRLAAVATVTGVPWKWITGKSQATQYQPGRPVTLEAQALVELIIYMFLETMAPAVLIEADEEPMLAYMGEVWPALNPEALGPRLSALLDVEAWRAGLLQAGATLPEASVEERETFEAAMARALAILLRPFRKVEYRLNERPDPAALRAAGEWIDRVLREKESRPT